MLSRVLQSNAFAVECIRAYSSRMLSSVFQWKAFERIPVYAFERIPAECFRASSSGMRSSVIQRTAFECIQKEILSKAFPKSFEINPKCKKHFKSNQTQHMSKR